jgi:outer membrane lipoprotein carrier protein
MKYSLFIPEGHKFRLSRRAAQLSCIPKGHKFRLSRRAAQLSCIFSILICLLLPVSSGASELPPEEIARQLQKTYERTTSMTANFRQSTAVRMSPREKHGSGTLAIQKPGRMRWDYLTPAPQVLVADGETVFMYFAQAEQMIVSPAKEYLQSDVTYAFFTGEGDILRDFKVLSGEDFFANTGDAHVLKLIPRQPHSQVQELRLWAHAESFLIERLQILDHFGTVTDLYFTEIKIDVDLPADLFTFTPPAGTEIIRQQ